VRVHAGSRVSRSRKQKVLRVELYHFVVCTVVVSCTPLLQATFLLTPVCAHVLTTGQYTGTGDATAALMLAWVHVLLKEQQQSGQEGSRSPGGEGVQELNNPYSRALQHTLATVKVSDYRPAAGVKYLMELYTRVTGHDSTQQSARPADTGAGLRGPVRRSQVSAYGSRLGTT
jgi:hypothetical protein